MPEESAVADFLAQKKLAVVGVSLDRTKYGNIVYRRLKDLGYQVFAINPKANTIEGDPCFPCLSDLHEPMDGIVVVAPPQVSEQVVREAGTLGIKRVWLQPGAESEEAVRICEENGVSAIWGLCIMARSKG